MCDLVTVSVTDTGMRIQLSSGSQTFKRSVNLSKTVPFLSLNFVLESEVTFCFRSKLFILMPYDLLFLNE